MKKQLIVFNLLLFSFHLFAKEIPYNLLFKTNVIGPSLVEMCDEKLWVFENGTNQLKQISKKTGDIQKSFTVLNWGDVKNVTSLGCYKSKLIAAVLDKNKKPALYLITGFKAEKLDYNVSDSGQIRDVVCNDEKCFIVHQNIYSSNDLKNWKKITIAKTSSIPTKGAKYDLNPFAEWQDKFNIVKDSYSRLAQADTGAVFLLDSFRSKIINLGKVNNDTVMISDQVNKWGKWGTWEGQLMYPKALKVFPKYDILVISDVGLKHLFFFSYGGTYFGKIGLGEGIKSFEYPLDFAIDDTNIYIADFLGNKLIGVEIASFDKTPEKLPVDVKDYLHRNLFKNPKVNAGFSKTRCLNCHDGLAIYSLNNFVKHKNFHPVDIKIKGKVDLPLWLGKYMSCATCHTQHHVPQLGRSVTKKGKLIKEEKLPHNLRKEYKELCTTCHKDRLDLNQNHIDLNLDLESTKVKAAKVVSCSQCHTMHNAERNLLGSVDSGICINCHSTKQQPKSHPFGEVKSCMKCHNPDMRPSTHPKIVKIESHNDQTNRKVQCFSCHKLHNSPRDEFFPKAGDKGRKWSCLNCHKNLTKHLGTNIHLMAFSKKSLPCMNCHNVHDKSIKDVSKTCFKCHPGKNQKHKRFAAMGNFAGGSIRLQNSNIVCTTCHQHHGISSDKSFLKGKDKIQNFCSSCHGTETPKVFMRFHKKLK